MKAYVYRADIYCEDCGKDIIGKLGHENELSFDSERWPQGPFLEGGGEADTPQHCGSCGTFLENPLTVDGYRYVAEQLDAYRTTGMGSLPTLHQWAEFYDCENAQLNEAITKFQDALKPKYREIAEGHGYGVYPYWRGAESGWAWGSDGQLAPGASPMTTEAEAWEACCFENDLLEGE